MVDERREDYINLHKDFKFEKVLMSVITLLMIAVTFFLADMHKDFKEMIKTVPKLQAELHAHTHDKRAHVPIRRLRND